MRELLRGGGWKTLLLAAVSALCFALPFQVSALGPLTFFGALFLFLFVSRLSGVTGLRRIFAAGFGFAFFYHLCLYHWFLSLHPLSAAGLEGAQSAFVVLLAYVGASAVHGFVFALGFFLWHLAFSRAGRAARLFGFIPCFLLSEALTSVGTLAMPWSRIGLPLAEVPVLMQSAALVGPWGVDLIILLIGACAALFCLEKELLRRSLCLLGAVSLFSANVLFGCLYEPQSEGTLRISVVQTNVTYDEKWSRAAGEVRESVRAAVLRAAQSSPDVIVLPESVLAHGARRGDETEAFFADLSGESGALIAAGAVFSEAGETYNAICLYDEEGLVSYNAKRHLVPFGEYLPWQDLFRVLLPAVADMSYYRSTYTPGEAGLSGVWEGISFGGLVCFDSLFSPLAVDSVREGAQVLLVCTNDAWFKESPAAREHLYQGVWRAVETGRSLAQSANVGLSALISPKGEILGEVGLAVAGEVTCDVPLASGATPYSVTGDLVIPLCAVCFFAALIASLFYRRRV